MCSCVCTLALKYALAPNAFAPVISVSSFFIVFGGSRQPSHFLVFPRLSSLSLPLYVPHIAAPDPVVKNEKKGKGVPSTAMHRLEPNIFPSSWRSAHWPVFTPDLLRSSHMCDLIYHFLALHFSFSVVTFRSFGARERERERDPLVFTHPEPVATCFRSPPLTDFSTPERCEESRSRVCELKRW